MAVDLEALAVEIRKQAEVYRSAAVLAEMLDLLGPLEETETLIKTRISEQNAESARLAKLIDEQKGRAQAVRNEYEKAMASLTRDLEVREREFEGELRAKHAEAVAKLEETERTLAERGVKLAAVNEQIAKLRGLFA